MIRPLIAKSLREAWPLLAALALVMFAFPWINIWVASMINLPAFSEFLANAVPQRFERLSEVPFNQLATPAGRVAIAYAHPLMLLAAAVWSIARGSDCVSGEIGRGTMEMLLAQPVRRTSIFFTQAAVTIAGSALLAFAAWAGTVVGLVTVGPGNVPAGLFLAPTINLFGRMVCVAGVAAMVSSWDSQRWRTVGVAGAWYVLSTITQVMGRMEDGWQWLRFTSFMNVYSPQAMVAYPDEAWSLLTYHNGAVAGIGLGGEQLVLLGAGLICYVFGSAIFSRREIPAPL